MQKASIFSKPLVAGIIVLFALVIDQVVKVLVEAYLPLQEAVAVVPHLALYRTYNLGVAFSMLSDLDGWFIVTMRLVIVAFVIWVWKKTENHRSFSHLGFALIVAGAAGNIFDRFLYGHVVDYILFYTQTWSFAVFNLADAFISVGAACVVLDEFLHSRSAAKKKD
jgi:signal peptidase II